MSFKEFLEKKEVIQHPYRKIFIKKGIKFCDLARYIGINKGSMSDYLNGKKKMPEHIEDKIAEALADLEA